MGKRKRIARDENLAETIAKVLRGQQIDAEFHQRMVERQLLGEVQTQIGMIHQQFHGEDRHQFCAPLRTVGRAIEDGDLVPALAILAGILGAIVVPLDDQPDLPIQFIHDPDAVRRILEEER